MTGLPWLDRAIGAVAPRTALKRVLARQSFEAISRGYDGAAKGRRTDGASVLIPNADFLSASVTNWTFKDRFARLHLTFQLPESLGADGGRELLLACAKGNANVQSDPPPRVLLEAIGGTYTFSMAADVADVTMMKEVASELRFAVDHELRKRPA